MGEIQGQSFQPSANAPIRGAFRLFRITSHEDPLQPGTLDDFLRPLRWLLKVAGQRISWSPTLIAGELWRLITNIGAQREILRLFKLRPLAYIAETSPRLAFKFLIPDYLSLGFTAAERASCLLHHYRYIMHTAVPESVLQIILQGEVTLKEISEGGNYFAFTLGLSRPPFDKEGELSLDLRVHGKSVYNLTFTIVPDWVVKSEVAEVLLITRLQGTRGCNTQIKLARKAFHEHSIRTLLLAALQGIADAFGIRGIAAVCATNQISYRKDNAAILQCSYDTFFAKLGMATTTTGFYSCPIPIEGRPLASFQGRNRSRARKRRAMRQEIQSACAACLLGAPYLAADSSSSAVNSTSVQRVLESRTSQISGPIQDDNLTL